MPGFVINGKVVPTPLFPSSNFLDAPSVKLDVGPGLDGIELGDNRGANANVRMLVFHTTKGDVTHNIRAGAGPRDKDPAKSDALRVARFWSTQKHQGGAHIVIDRDGDVHTLADLGRVCAHHASNSDVNRNSVGIEVYQEGEKDHFALYEIQLTRVVQVADQLTKIFGIQRQIPLVYKKRPIGRLASGGRDCVGVFGHRDVTSNRGEGDPGSQIMAALGYAGYESWHFDLDEDKRTWRERQAALAGVGAGVVQIDGIPYTQTALALAKTGRKHGQWVARPGD